MKRNKIMYFIKKIEADALPWKLKTQEHANANRNKPMLKFILFRGRN